MSENATCGHNDPYTDIRFGAIIGSSILASLGLVFNGMLVFVFIRLSLAESRQKTSHLYLTILAMLDACLCLTFDLVFGLDALALHIPSEFLFHFYYDSILYTFALSRFVLLAIPYVIIVATFERWLGGTGYQFSPLFKGLTSERGRIIIIVAVLIVTLLVRLPSNWTYRVHHFEDCDYVFNSIQMVPTEFSANEQLQFFNFYILSAIQVFVPFGMLIPLNLAIVKNIQSGKESLYVNLKRNISDRVNKVSISISRTTPRSSDAQRPQLRRRKMGMQIQSEERPDDKKFRQALYTILVIVSTYIICNIPNFVLTIMEKLKSSIIMDQHGVPTSFYMVYSDVISVLFMFNSFTRIFIYYFCNQQVREQLIKMVCLNRKKVRKTVQNPADRLSMPRNISLQVEAKTVAILKITCFETTV